MHLHCTVHITDNFAGTYNMCMHHSHALSSVSVFILLFSVSIHTSYVPVSAVPVSAIFSCLSLNVLVNFLTLLSLYIRTAHSLKLIVVVSTVLPLESQFCFATNLLLVLIS